MPGEVLSFQPWSDEESGDADTATRTYRVGVVGEQMSQRLEAIMPLLGRLLQEKSETERERKLERLVDVMTAQMVVPSVVETRMARRLAERHARLLNEFGGLGAEQLAELNHSRAASRTALADNWKRRGQVFAVRQRDEAGVEQEVFPQFQFDEQHRPRKIIQAIIAAFGPHKAAWKLALWFTSANGWLPGQARPADLLDSQPDAVLQAARRDAQGSAA
jgi:hypothetical protein